MHKRLDYDYCPAGPLLEWLGDKWVLATFITLHDMGTARFSELYRAIPSVSEKMLAGALRTLETDGLVTRTLYPEVPPRAEYTLSDLGRTLYPPLEGLLDWAQQNLPAILERREHAARG